LNGITWVVQFETQGNFLETIMGNGLWKESDAEKKYKHVSWGCAQKKQREQKRQMIRL